MTSSSLSLWGRVVFSIIAVVGCLFGGVAGCLTLASMRVPPELREPVPQRFNVDLFQVERATVREVVTGFGSAEPVREVVVSAQVAGEIIAVHPDLKVGTEVKGQATTSNSQGRSETATGDLIAQIDPRVYEEQLLRAKTQLEDDRLELTRIEQESTNLERLAEQLEQDRADNQAEYDKFRKLYEKGGVATESDLRKAQLTLRGVEKLIIENENARALLPVRMAQVHRALAANQNQIRLAEIDLQNTTVRPPFRGILSSVSIEQGQFVRPGDPLVTITDVNKVEIPISITLSDFAKIKPRLDSGTLPPVALASNESASELWTGELLRASPKVDPATRTVVVYVRVDNAQQSTPLLPGTFVQARIEGPVHQEVLVVPRDALIRSDVYIARDDGSAERRAVNVVERLQAFAIVSDGVEEGDRVVLSNLDVLNSGSLIQPQRSRTLDEELQEQRARLLSRIDEPKDRLTKKPSE